MSQVHDTPVHEIDWDALSPPQLQEIAQNDERSTVRDRASKLYDERTAPPAPPTIEDNPREDPGPVRFEDTWPQELPEGEEPVELTSPEVPLTDSVKDHTTVLATDVFNGEGQIINREVPEAPQQ